MTDRPAITLPEWRAVPEAVLLWLRGEGPDDNGHWFGEGPDADRPGAFWWRHTLTRMLQAAPEPPAGVVAVRPAEDIEWLARASVSVAEMVAQWYRGPLRGNQDIPADLITRRLERFVPVEPPASPDHSARIAELEAENARLRGALTALERGATLVADRGAVSGGQWVGLNITLLKARAALKAGGSNG